MMIVNYTGSILIFILGLYMILVKKDMVKIIMGIFIMDSGINLFFVSMGFRLESNVSPAVFQNTAQELSHNPFVDPIPQALALVSILICACVVALALSLVIKVYEHYGTINTDEVRRLNR